MHLSARGRVAAIVTFSGALGAAFLFAQSQPQPKPQAQPQPQAQQQPQQLPDWKTMVNVPGVDFSGLTPVKARALRRLLRTHNCTCGCSMKVAECRVKDTPCAWSKGVAAAMGDALRAGKNENDAIEVAKASKWGQGPQQPKLLEDRPRVPIAPPSHSSNSLIFNAPTVASPWPSSTLPWPLIPAKSS